MLDAWGRIAPSSFLLGNVMWVGSWDECVGTPGTRYCVTPVIIRNASAVVSAVNQSTPVFVAYGSCFPVECGVRDVGEVMKVIPKVSIFVRKVGVCEERKDHLYV